VHVLVNIYKDKEKNIELHEEQPLPIVVGATCKYTAMVTIQVQMDDNMFPQEIITEQYEARGYEDAFKKAPEHIQKAIQLFQENAQKEIEAAKEEAMGPSIITPDQIQG
jgi:glucosamine 6-phosphate synthetase-like amidotransferase/phosphosugar isomerase protein